MQAWPRLALVASLCLQRLSRFLSSTPPAPATACSPALILLHEDLQLPLCLLTRTLTKATSQPQDPFCSRSHHTRLSQSPSRVSYTPVEYLNPQDPRTHPHLCLIEVYMESLSCEPVASSSSSLSPLGPLHPTVLVWHISSSNLDVAFSTAPPSGRG
jgi:hypothetical protein